MMKGRVGYKWILILALFVSTLSVYGQKESAIWYFGQHAGLDFREHFPLPLTDGQTNTSEGVASVSDSLGNLLFYTDGRTIWNRNHGIMAAGLSGDSVSTHSATIIPNRNNPDQYFVFTTKQVSSPDDDNYGGNYYIVDFTNDALGEVIYDHSEETGFEGILKNSTEKFAAVPYLQTTEEGSTIPSYRLLMHGFRNDSFAHYNLDSLIHHFRYQAIGSWHLDSVNDDGSHGGASGQMKVSMQGNRVAVALEGERRFEVYNFNKETGELSNPIFLPAGDRIGGKTKFIRMAYGVEFSPSGRYLYGTSKDGGWIYQWDLNIRAVAEMRARVSFIRSNPELNCGALQLAPNGKIYVAIVGQDYLGVINSPNNLDCEYKEFGARLLDNDTDKGGFSELGLPATLPIGTKPEAFYFNHTCLGELTSFYITDRTGMNFPFFAISKWETGEFLANVTGAYDPVAGTNIYDYTFQEAGEYKVVLTAIKSGVPVEYTRKMTIYAPPESQWPRDTVLCSGSQIVLDAGNGAFYYWVESTARDRYLLVDSLGINTATGAEYAAKEFRVAVTHYNGCITWDTVNVIRKYPPVLTFESTEAKCAESNGTATVIPNGAIENYTYRWEDFPGETSNKITDIPGGVYRAYVTSNQTGCESFVDITVEAQGTVRIVSSVAADSLVCPGTEITLTAENADFFDWIIPEGGGESQVVVSPEVTTTYRVRGVSTDGDGGVCETEFEYLVEVAPINIPELGEDLSSCYGDTIWIEAPDDYLDYYWDNGMTGQSIMLTQAVDKLALYAQDTNYCTFRDEISVEFYIMPPIAVTSEKALCGQLNGSATVVPEGNPDDYTYFWEDFPDNTSNIIFDVGAGMYRIQVSSLLTGCDTLLEIVVQEFGAPETVITASVNEPVCPGTPITLTAQNADYYVWINPEGPTDEQIIIEPYFESTYIVMGISRDEEGNECKGYAEITIPVLPYNKPDVGPDLSACEGDTITLEGGDIFEEWTWSNGMSGMLVQITENIPELVLTALDNNQCAATDTIGIIFHPYPEVYLGEDQTLCTNEPVVLQGGSGENYLWSTDETTKEISVLENGLYWLEISTAGCAARDSLTLQIVNPDSILIDTVIVRDISCFGEVDGEINIFAHGTGDTYTYSIDGGFEYFDNGGRFENLQAGDHYRVRVLEDSVCARNYGIPITITEPTELLTNYQLASPSCASCLDGQISLTLIDGGSPPFSVLWDNFETDTIRTGIGVGSYSVTITDSRDCYKELFFDLDLSYLIPNAFTPNEDGVNDFWKIGIIEYHPEAIVKIYDSRGRLLFESGRGYPEPWDGKYEGNYVSMGTYYYLIYLNDEDKPLTGHLTLLR